MKNFITKRNKSFLYQIKRLNSMRFDKISNMLFLNDLNSFDVQKMRLDFVFRYY